MRYEIKIVNLSRGNRKVSRASMKLVRERTIFPPRFRASVRATVFSLFFFFLSVFFFFFFCKSVKRAQFRHGIFIGVDSSLQYTYPPPVPRSCSPANFSFKLRQNSFSQAYNIVMHLLDENVVS